MRSEEAGEVGLAAQQRVDDGHGDGDELFVGGFDGGGVVVGDAGAHEVAVALFAASGGEEAFAGGPGGGVGVVVEEGVFGELVGGVVDGDDGVADVAFGVGPGVAVGASGEGCSVDELEGGSEMPCPFGGFCRVLGGVEVVFELVEVGSEVVVER